MVAISKFDNLNSAEQANSAVQYFSKNIGFIRQILADEDPEKVQNIIDGCWANIIKACRQYAVPLTYEAEINAQRLGL